MNHHTGSMRTASLTAGVALALMAALAAFGVFGAIDALITPGDAAKTAQHISEAQALFRQGIASLILVAVLDIVVAGALFTLFAPVDRTVSLAEASIQNRIR